MQFPEKEIYSALIDQINASASYFTNQDHPVAGHFDWDRRQYEVAGEATEFPFNRPAIFFRFGKMEYTTRSGYSRRGRIPITVVVVQDKYVDAMEGATTQPEYLKLLEWKYLVNDVLDRFKGSCVSAMEMVSIETDHDNRNLHVEYIDYECHVTLTRNVISSP